MIKIVKIFKNYQGKNITNEKQSISVSSTLMLDM